MNGQLVKRKLDNKTVAFDSALALPKATKIFLAQYFPCRLTGDDLDTAQLKQSTTHGQPFDLGELEPWKGAEHKGRPEVAAHAPCKAKEGSCLTPSWLSLPAGLGHTFGTCASRIWRQHKHTHTHTSPCLLLMFEMPGLLIIYLKEISSGRWVTKNMGESLFIYLFCPLQLFFMSYHTPATGILAVGRGFFI